MTSNTHSLTLFQCFLFERDLLTTLVWLRIGIGSFNLEDNRPTLWRILCFIAFYHLWQQDIHSNLYLSHYFTSFTSKGILIVWSSTNKFFIFSSNVWICFLRLVYCTSKFHRQNYPRLIQLALLNIRFIHFWQSAYPVHGMYKMLASLYLSSSFRSLIQFSSSMELPLVYYCWNLIHLMPL